MANADMSYLLPLFELAGSLVDDDDEANVSFGLAEAHADSSIARDNERTDGYWPSVVVFQSIGSALDHVIALRHLVMGSGIVTNAAPWTILRGVVEPAALAVWVLNGSNRERRQERALRVWYHDMEERGKWERDIGDVAVPPAMSGKARAAQMLGIAKSLNLRQSHVSTRLDYANIVGDAGEIVGWTRAVATARWRECSGFAHGRQWAAMRLSDPQSATRIRGGVIVAVGLAEEHHRKVATLATALLERALTDWAKAAEPSSV